MHALQRPHAAVPGGSQSPRVLEISASKVLSCRTSSCPGRRSYHAEPFRPAASSQPLSISVPLAPPSWPKFGFFFTSGDCGTRIIDRSPSPHDPQANRRHLYPTAASPGRVRKAAAGCDKFLVMHRVGPLNLRLFAPKANGAARPRSESGRRGRARWPVRRPAARGQTQDEP